MVSSDHGWVLFSANTVSILGANQHQDKGMLGMAAIFALIGKFFKEMIEALLALRRWLVYRTKPSQFLSPSQYYAEYLQPTSTIHHLGSCVGRDDDLSQLAASLIARVDSRRCPEWSKYKRIGSSARDFSAEIGGNVSVHNVKGS